MFAAAPSLRILGPSSPVQRAAARLNTNRKQPLFHFRVSSHCVSPASCADAAGERPGGAPEDSTKAAFPFSYLPTVSNSLHLQTRLAGVEAALGDYDGARKDVAAKRRAELKHARKTDGRTDAQLEADEAAAEAVMNSGSS